MNIAILGAGQIGSTVGRLWAKSGHDVCFATRHPEQLDELVKSIGERAAQGTAKEIVAGADAVLLAVPLKATPALAKDLGALLAGKVVLDATNPYPERDGDFAREAINAGRGSSAWTAKQLSGARVVKAFNMQRYSTLQAAAGDSADPLIIALASDDREALDVAARLVRDAGFEPYVVGRLEDGRRFDPGTPYYGKGLRRSGLRRDESGRAQT